MDNDHSPEKYAEFAALVSRLKPWQIRVTTYLCALLPERQVAASTALDAEIERVEEAQQFALLPKSESRHRLAVGTRVLSKSVLAGLHHEYLLATASASA